jgi:hypothetical protein
MIGDVKNVYDSIDIIVYWSLTLEAVKATFTVVTSTCFPLNMYRDICIYKHECLDLLLARINVEL